jgi:aminoglycoside phosphotransferase (APT) family kinase protein
MKTKNKQSEETIKKLAKSAFPNKEVANIQELTEGLCNVAYYVLFQDGSESILKIAAKDSTGYTSNEISLMKAEVMAMRLVAEQSDIPLASVQYYDSSRSICDGDYFFMEKLSGDNYYFMKDKMPQEQIDTIDKEVGIISRKLTKIRNAKFGFLGDETRYDSLYEFVKVMLTNLISDAKKKEIDIVYDGRELISALARDKWAFKEVKDASLVHWDLWEGNVFVNDGHVCGIIDWERAMWGEAFMDNRFRFHCKSEAFLQGFEKTDFSEAECRRIRWYDIILYLTMMIEVYYREFEDEGQYFWAREMLEKVV